MKKTALLLWYKQNGRHELPWRNTNNAYHIYLSEIMLQQTQVKTVLERFYFQFLEKFPSFESLCAAKESDVLKAWEGLGYYTRARNIYKTAKMIQKNLPSSVKELLELPGIGPSTANAIACFAFGKEVPILDANVKRILYRYYKIKTAKDKELWLLSHKLFSSYKKHAYAYNQALMDLGSQVCTSKKPLCNNCPLNEGCEGKNEASIYPEKKPKKQKELRNRQLIIYKYKDKYALFQNENNLLKGLWSFKQYQVLKDELYDTYLGEIKHEYSHISLRAKIYLRCVSKEHFKSWFNKDEISELALSKIDHKALALEKKYNEG